MLIREQMIGAKKTRIAQIIANYKKQFRGISKNPCNIFILTVMNNRKSEIVHRTS